MSVLTFISRKVRARIRPRKRLYAPPPPSNLSWRKFKAPKIKRKRWPIALQKWRHLAYPPPAPLPPVGFVPRQSRYLLQMRVRRRKFWRRRPRTYTFPGTAPPVSNVMVLQRVWRVYLTRPSRG